MGELSRIGFATYDEAFQWVIVHDFLDWNRIENPNQGKAAAKLIDQVPTQSAVYPLLGRALREFGANLPEALLKRFGTVCLDRDIPAEATCK